MILTPRQRQVVELLAQDLTCQEIARRMNVRLATVRAHVQQIRKLINDDSGLPAVRLIRRKASDLLRVA